MIKRDQSMKEFGCENKSSSYNAALIVICWNYLY